MRYGESWAPRVFGVGDVLRMKIWKNKKEQDEARRKAKGGKSECAHLLWRLGRLLSHLCADKDDNQQYVLATSQRGPPAMSNENNGHNPLNLLKRLCQSESRRSSTKVTKHTLVSWTLAKACWWFH